MKMCSLTLNVRGTAPRSSELNPLDVYLWGHLKPLAYSAPNENETTPHQSSFLPVKKFPTTPGPLKLPENPCSENSSVRVATGYGRDGSGIESR
jgi:hypothetical protein